MSARARGTLIFLALLALVVLLVVGLLTFLAQ
jgi:hypothetical protein